MNISSETIQIQEAKTSKGIFWRKTFTADSADHLVLVMGYGGSLRIWPQSMVQRLAQKFVVITYDNRGTGLSIIPQQQEEYTIRSMADDLDEVISTLEIQTHHLLGYSMGSCIALQYAHDHQERVSSLFLMSGTAGGALYAKPDKAVSAALAKPAGNTLWDVYMSTFSLMYSPAAFERCMPKFKAIYEVSKELPTKPLALAGHSYAFKNFDAVAYLPGLNIPTTILAGRDDRLMPVKNSENLAQNIANAKLIIFDECEHGPHIQDEDKVVELLERSILASKTSSR